MKHYYQLQETVIFKSNPEQLATVVGFEHYLKNGKPVYSIQIDNTGELIDNVSEDDLSIKRAI